jgi:serine/threonine protein kinase
MQQLLQGLAAVQAANVSHRDVKPENLLVRPAAAAAASGTAAAADLSAGSQHQRQEQHAQGHHPNVDTPKNSGTSSSSSGDALTPDPLSLHLKLIDFGSALDPGSIAAGLYGRPQATAAGAEGGFGPSLDELTLEYAPPEVIFSSRCAAGVLAYDLLLCFKAYCLVGSAPTT